MLPDHWRFSTFKVYYRLCDKQPKVNHPQLTWKVCFKNFIKHYGTSNLHIICDNCDQSTIEYAKSINPTTLDIQSLGNSPSFNYMIDKILSECRDTDIVYMVESDYLHLPNIKENILDGLNFGHYVTLYDSPDQYMNNSPNLHIKNGVSTCELYGGITSHWRTVSSTTMTFATHVKTLREDYSVITKHTKQSPPSDYEMFLELTRTRKLVSPLPSKSTHCAAQYISRYVDWNSQLN